MEEFWELLNVLVGAPQDQFWFLVGIIAGSIFDLRFRKSTRPQVITALVFLVFLLPLRFLAPLTGFTLVYAVIFVMTGFVGFCAAWLPGLLLGRLWGFMVDRAERRAVSPHAPRDNELR